MKEKLLIAVVLLSLTAGGETKKAARPKRKAAQIEYSQFRVVDANGIIADCPSDRDHYLARKLRSCKLAPGRTVTELMQVWIEERRP